jgi:hypothetical protein
MRLAKFMRRAAVVMSEAAARVTVVMVVMHGMMRRSRLLRESDSAGDRDHAHGKRADQLRSQRHFAPPHSMNTGGRLKHPLSLLNEA